MATRTNNVAAAKIAEQASNSASAQIAINDALAGEVKAIFVAQDAAAKAKTAAEKAAAGVDSAREACLIGCARLSHEGSWTPDMIETGIKAAIRANYGPDADMVGPGNLRNLKTELASVMQADRREHVGRIFKLVGDAYDAEGKRMEKAKEGEKVDTPLRGAYGRKYHAQLNRVRALSEVSKKDKAGVTHTTPGEKSASAAEIVTAAKAKIAKSAKTPTAQAGADLKIIIDRLATFATKYQKEEKFGPIIDTLRKIPHADLVPSGNNDPVYVAAVLPASDTTGEVVDAASDFDAAVAEPAPAAPAPAVPDLAAEFIAFQQWKASQAK